MLSLSDIRLTRGQLIHALWWPRGPMPYNQEPTKEFVARLNYLRLNGVPFDSGQDAPGSGNRLVYGFDELAELALAIELTDLGIAPGDVAKVLVGKRIKLRKMCRIAYQHRDNNFGLEQLEEIETPFGFGYLMECTIRRAGPMPTLGGFRLLHPAQASNELLQMGGTNCSKVFVHLSALMDRIVNAAREAPEFVRGRRRRK